MRLLLPLLMLHGGLVAWTFPVHELWTATPMTHIDAPFHAYQIEVAKTLCKDLRIIGYDPFFAAGHLGGVPYNASAKAQALVACMAGGVVDGAVIYKVTTFILAICAPGVLLLGYRRLGLPPAAALAAGVFGLILWWAGPLRWYHTAGMVSFVAAMCISIWFAPYLLERCSSAVTSRSTWTLKSLAAAALGALGVLLHPLFAISTAVLVACLGATDGLAKLRTARALTVCALVIAATLAVNLPWVLPTLQYPGFGSGVTPYQKAVGLHLVALELIGRAPTAAGGSRFYVVILLGALAAPFAVGASQRPKLLGLTCAGVALIAYAFIAGHSAALGTLQPNRMAAVGWLVLCAPAGLAAAALPRIIRRGSDVARRAALLCGLVMIAGTAFYAREVALEVFRRDGPHHGMTPPEVRGLGTTTRGLIDLLRAEPDGGRVFFETSLGRTHDGGHVAGLLARETGRELVGGPYPYMHLVSAWDRHAFGRPMASIHPEELKRYLNLYNVTWMVCHTTECRRAMEGLADASSRAFIGPTQVFRRNSRSDYAISGDVHVVSRGINALTLRIGPTHEAIVKYHWVDGLRSDPPAELSPWQSPLDPQPFIRIRNPPPELTIRYDGR